MSGGIVGNDMNLLALRLVRDKLGQTGYEFGRGMSRGGQRTSPRALEVQMKPDVVGRLGFELGIVRAQIAFQATRLWSMPCASSARPGRLIACLVISIRSNGFGEMAFGMNAILV